MTYTEQPKVFIQWSDALDEATDWRILWEEAHAQHFCLNKMELYMGKPLEGWVVIAHNSSCRCGRCPILCNDGTFRNVYEDGELYPDDKSKNDTIVLTNRAFSELRGDQ